MSFVFFDLEIWKFTPFCYSNFENIVNLAICLFSMCSFPSSVLVLITTFKQIFILLASFLEQKYSVFTFSWKVRLSFKLGFVRTAYWEKYNMFTLFVHEIEIIATFFFKNFCYGLSKITEHRSTKEDECIKKILVHLCYGPLKYVTTSKVAIFCIFYIKTSMYQVI